MRELANGLDLHTVARLEASGLLVGDQLNATAVANALAETSESLDIFFVLVSGVLVFLMQAGFAMLTAGSVRTKNVKNVLLKNVLDACVGAMAYFLFGWAFAYGENSAVNGFIGSGQYALSGGFGRPGATYGNGFVSITHIALRRIVLSNTPNSTISSSNGPSLLPPRLLSQVL